MNPQTKTAKAFYRFFNPPADWEKVFDSKEYSLYYTIGLKKYGRDFAEECWKKRQDILDRNYQSDNTHAIYAKVKNYVPRDLLCLIGVQNLGFIKKTYGQRKTSHNKTKKSL